MTPVPFTALSSEDTERVRAGVERVLCARHLIDYVKSAWHVVEPATPYQHNWHIEAICEHLEAVTRGEICKLLITIPPRCQKSLTVAVFWPTWVWITRPATRWLFSSYAQGLSTRDSLKCRRLIESPWYRARWGHIYRLTGDQNLKTRYDTDKTGYRLATSVDGSNTGEGGDFIICDDPNNVKEGESDAVREATNLWWDEAMSTRGNNPKTVAHVIVQQRVHDHDLAGHVIAQGGYVHLTLPMRFEVETKCFLPVTGWEDPRTAEGELLWSERFGEPEVRELEKRLGSYAAAAQLQQRPAPRGGGMIQLAWFKRYQLKPLRPKRVVQSWDTANKKKEENAPWVCSTWHEHEDGDYLVHVSRARMEYPEGKKKVYELAKEWHADVVLVEDKSSGQSLIQDIRATNRERDSQKIVVIPIEPEGDKVTRMSVESPAIEAGMVWLPEEAEWLPEYEKELRIFPNSQFCDQVDSTSQFLAWKRKKRQQFADAKPVHTSFVRHVHVAAQTLTFEKTRWMYCGWHVGMSAGVHAVVWVQVVDRGLRLFGACQMAGAFGNEVGYEAEEIDCSSLGAFVDEVLELRAELFPGARWQEVGSPEVFKTPRYGYQEVPRRVFGEYQLSLTPASTQEPTVLVNYVDSWLQAMVKGEPAFQLDPSAQILIDAFAGGYARKADGSAEPAEGPFSSVMTALQCLCSRLPTKPFSRSSQPEPVLGLGERPYQRSGFQREKEEERWEDY